MWNWLMRRRAEQRIPAKSTELKGAPSHARVKTHSAETGFVYRYVYRGYRRMSDDRGTEHVFEVDRDRGQHFHATVYLLDTEVDQCAGAVGRELIGAERYALVKMTLFAALNEYVDVADFERPMVPDALEMQEHLRTLGRI